MSAERDAVTPVPDDLAPTAALIDRLAAAERDAAPVQLESDVLRRVLNPPPALRLAGRAQPILTHRVVTPMRLAAAFALAASVLTAIIAGRSSGPTPPGSGTVAMDDWDAALALMSESDDGVSMQIDALLADAAKLSSSSVIGSSADFDLEEDAL